MPCQAIVDSMRALCSLQLQMKKSQRNRMSELVVSYSRPCCTNLGYYAWCHFPENLVPPQFTQTLENIRVEENQTIRLETKFDGKPEPEVQWSKDGQKLDESL